MAASQLAYGNSAPGSTPSLDIVGFDIATGRALGAVMKIYIEKGQNEVFRVAVNADGTQVAVGGGVAGEVRIFEIRSATLLTTIPPPADMQSSMAGQDAASGAWAPDGTLYVGSSGTHLRQFDPTTFNLIRDLTVPPIATGGSLQFSDDGTFLIASGTLAAEGGPEAMTRVDLGEGRVGWKIDPEALSNFGCWRFAFSVPDDRLWCADFSGVIRGRSLSTGEFDGSEIEHQRSGLSDLALQTLGGHRYLVVFGAYSAFIGRWQIDGAGPIARNVADGYDGAVYSPDGRWLLVLGPAPEGETGFRSAVWDPLSDRPVITLPRDLIDVSWLDDDRLGEFTPDGHAQAVDVRTGEPREVAWTSNPAGNGSTVSGTGGSPSGTRIAMSTCSTSTKGHAS